MNRPAGLSFICYAMLWNSIGLMLIGFVTTFGVVEGVPFWSGPLIILCGFALGRAIGDFLRLDTKGVAMFRISAVIFALFLTVGFASGIGNGDLVSWIFPILVFVFTLLIFFLIEAYIREKIAEAS